MADVEALWLRTDLLPESEHRPGGSLEDQPQVLRVLVKLAGDPAWRVAIEYTIEATGQIISHITEGHALHNRRIDPVTDELAAGTAEER